MSSLQYTSPTTEIYTLSLHDALPIYRREGILGNARLKLTPNWVLLGAARYDLRAHQVSQTQLGVGYIDDCLILALNYIRSEEHTSELQSRENLVCRLLLEKKK